ncbi:MAG: carboxypeptidase-like regulatory domain-containing protein [Planctomycetaceae bacterium]|jgi:hypothetical protein|nr:carboxypeptidase-like regulatory domain-containing protein [Planctomycetaceae bacterium]
MKNLLSIFSTLVLLTVISSTGCGSGLQFGGVVQFDDGTPVQGAMVSFIDAKNQYDGQTDAQGRYTLHGATLKDGIPAGEYRVAISRRSSDDEKSTFPEKYAAVETSGLTCEVKEKGNTTFDITIIRSEKK